MVTMFIIDLVTHAFVVATEELAYGDDDIDLCSTIGQGEGCLSNLDLGEGLR